MRFCISIFLCFAFTLTKAQSCETYFGKTINCIDKESLKQGFWYEYKIIKILTTDSLRRNPKAFGFHNDEGRVEIPIAEGYYKDNKKIGEWKFYKGLFYNDNYANPTSHEQKVIYTDSNYFRIIDTFWHFIATVSNDTSNLEGTLFLKDDTVKIICRNKLCYLKDPFKKNKKQKFPFKELDNKLIWLNFRSYKVKQTKIGS
jgi:hypothetical protein